MTPGRWRRIEELFNSAGEQAPEGRRQFLIAACGDDEELRKDVESLLACDERTATFLDSPALGFAAAPAACTLAAGQQLGPYRIVGLLGTGGMGEVYRAADTRLGRQVAIKLLPPQLARDPEALERFRREARAASALNHSNICTLHDIGEHNGQPFLVMELLEGQSLRERLAGGPLPPGELLAAGASIADAVQAAHSKGILHRDIKPANIFLTPRGEPKILDFGVAKLLSEPAPPPDEAGQTFPPAASCEATISKPGRTPGTIAYMSPEQIRGEPLDPRSDVFSLGVTLYQMATGELPFQGETPALLREAILSGQPRPPRKLNPALPAGLDRIILKTLQKDRPARYASAGELCAGLRLLAAPRRRPAWIWIGLVIFGVILLAAAFSVMRTPRTAPVARIRPLTTFPGIEQFPTFSPDGRYVAFLWDGEARDQFDLYRIPVTGGVPERLTNDSHSECHPSWSPDGRSIAFFHCSQGTSEAMRETRIPVWILDIAGARKRRIADVYSPENPGTAVLAWTGDSRGLIVEDRMSIRESFGLFLLDVENGQKRRLTSPPPGSRGDRLPAVSADERTLAFVRGSASGVTDIHLVDLTRDSLARSGPRRLTWGAGQITDLMWSGNRELLYAAGQNGVRGLWRISLASRTPRAIPSLAPLGDHLALSRQGGRLAYTQGHTDDDIWRLDLTDQSDTTGRPFLCSTRWDQSPNISADGRKIAFDSERSGNSEIWVSDSDGSHVRQVTSLGHAAGTPRWSPDGTQLAFDYEADGNVDIYVVRAGGDGLRRLTSDPGSDAVPSWSRDGQWVYFSSNRTGNDQIWKAPAGGGREVQVTTGGGFGGFESADGKLFYYAKTSTPPASLWSVLSRGGAEMKVFDGLKSWQNFAVMADGIYFRPENPIPGGFLVAFYDYRTGRVRTVREVRTRPGSGFTVAPGAKWLLFAAREFRGGDLMILDSVP